MASFYHCWRYYKQFLRVRVLEFIEQNKTRITSFKIPRTSRNNIRADIKSVSQRSASVNTRPRGLGVMTSRLHREDRGFDSHRGHFVLLFLFFTMVCYFLFILDMIIMIIILSLIPLIYSRKLATKKLIIIRSCVF